MLINPHKVGSPLLSRQRIAVSTEGDMVNLTIGNADIKMPYETAIQLSTWLRVRGKEAKRRAGDQSRHWSVIGIIDGLAK
jgi:hypothetical protein